MMATYTDLVTPSASVAALALVAWLYGLQRAHSKLTLARERAPSAARGRGGHNASPGGSGPVAAPDRV